MYYKYPKSNLIILIGGFGHGTCQAKISNAALAEKILMGIRVISKKY